MVLGSVFLGVSVALQAAEPPQLNVYNWTDYITPEVLAQFTEETGIVVNYQTYESNEELSAALADASVALDLVGPSAEVLSEHLKAGRLQPLDRSQLTRFPNLDTTLLEKTAFYDPGNQYALPYLWGTVGIGYNMQALADRGVSAKDLATWGSFFDPQVMQKFSDCGINLLDSPDDIFDVGLKFLGLDPSSSKSVDQYKVGNLLAKIRPYVTSFDSSGYIDRLASGDVCITLAWSGDVALARDRAEAIGSSVRLEYVIPSEGTALWIDTLAIPARAKHPRNAHLFLNFLLRPEVIAAVSNYAQYANANASATPLVDASLRSNPSIYMSSEALAKTWLATPFEASAANVRAKLWQRLVARE